MTESKGTGATPGPWRTTGRPVEVVRADELVSVANEVETWTLYPVRAGLHDVGYALSKANAHLIAAAPAMQEALTNALRLYDRDAIRERQATRPSGEGFMVFVTTAEAERWRAALAAARGEGVPRG